MVRHWMIEAREAKGMNMEQAATALDMSIPYYYMIETGQRKKKLDLPFAMAVSKVLGVPLTEICDREGII